MAQVPVPPLNAQAVQAAINPPQVLQPPIQAAQPVAQQAAQPVPQQGAQAVAQQDAQPVAQPQNQQEQPELDLKTLTATVENLQKQVATNSVEHALDFVRQLANRPIPLIDNHALLAALEQLADTARETGHDERKKVRRYLPPVQAARKGRPPCVGHHAFVRRPGGEASRYSNPKITQVSDAPIYLRISSIFLGLISKIYRLPTFINAISARSRTACMDVGAIPSVTAAFHVACMVTSPATAQDVSDCVFPLISRL